MSDETFNDRRTSDAKVDALAVRLDALEVELRANSGVSQSALDVSQRALATVERIEAITQGIMLAVEAAKELWDFLTRWGIRLRRWSYSTGKWVTAVAGAFAAVFAMLKGATDIDLIEHLLKWWRR